PVPLFLEGPQPRLHLFPRVTRPGRGSATLEFGNLFWCQCGFDVPQDCAVAITHSHGTERLSHDFRLLFRQDQFRHGSTPFRPQSTAPGIMPTISQCPMYFAYSVRARSTSLVPLMIARPSGNTVNSCPSAVNLSRKRLKLTSLVICLR